MTAPTSTIGEAIEVTSVSATLEAAQKIPLLQTNNFELVQFLIPVGRQIPTHQTQSDLIVHCLAGRVSLVSDGTTHELAANQLRYLPVGELFSLRGIEPASVLVTILRAKQGPNVELIG